MIPKITPHQQKSAILQQHVEEFTKLYSNVPCGYHCLDKDGNLIAINDTELTWLGYTSREVVGKNISHLLTPSSLSIFQKIYPKFQHRGWLRELELEMIRKDGTILPVLINATAVKDADGTFVLSKNTVFDISDRKRAEEALRSSEVRFRNLVETISDWVWELDQNGVCTYSSPQTTQILGYSPNETLGKMLSDFVVDDERSHIISIFNSIIATQKPFQGLEMTCTHKDGHGVVLEANGVPFFDAFGKFQGYRGVNRDITARKQSEALRRNLTTALESAVEGISQLNAQGRYIYVNQAYAHLLGYKPEEMMGMEWKLTLHPDDREKVSQAYKEMLSNGKAETEARAIRKDGSVFDKQTVMVKTCDQNQQFIGSYCFVKDISDRREIERLKDEFVSVVSHELRTPLTSIRGSLGLLAGGVLRNQAEKAQRMLEIAVKNSDRLIRLINDILDIERIASGKVQMNKEICDTASLMTQSVDVMRAMADKAGVTLSVSPLSLQLWADPDRIIQTFTNLLSNAIKFSDPGSTVWFTAKVGNGEWGMGNGEWGMGNGEKSFQTNLPTPHILFQIRDKGRGIPEEKLETIFGRFQQVDASDSRKKGGTGLGLAICRSIVQHHDGRIWVESTLGEGSVFYVSLPISRRKIKPNQGGLCDEQTHFNH